MPLEKIRRNVPAVLLISDSQPEVSEGVNGEPLFVHEGNNYTLFSYLTAETMAPSAAVRSVIWLFKRSHGGAYDILLTVWKRQFLNQSFPTHPFFNEQYEETVSAVGHNGYFTLLVSNASVELHDGRFSCLTGSVTGKEIVKVIDVVVSYGPQLQLNDLFPTVWANISSNIFLHLSVVAGPTPELVCEHSDCPSDHSSGLQVINRTVFERTHHFSIRFQPMVETVFGAYNCSASNEAGSVSVLLCVLPTHHLHHGPHEQHNRRNCIDSGPLHGRNEATYRRAKQSGACPAGLVDPEREHHRREHAAQYHIQCPS
ncbi:hypothetical protein BV898_09529 [Hypsibius exemplaris]|uniref:Ig-like domain-containing protein n=1 Tax=Hypsibius exemplaris TaxID=2072580 RepID=A0A1W0WMF7_HYPEX|nr:hypothetical protein BV898_09529 [Hypsibius exemplaris]